jgi:hypothetical protein
MQDKKTRNVEHRKVWSYEDEEWAFDIYKLIDDHGKQISWVYLISATQSPVDGEKVPFPLFSEDTLERFNHFINDAQERYLLSASEDDTQG